MIAVKTCLSYFGGWGGKEEQMGKLSTLRTCSNQLPSSAATGDLSDIMQYTGAYSGFQFRVRDVRGDVGAERKPAPSWVWRKSP